MIVLRQYQKDVLNHADILNILRHLTGERSMPDILAPLIVAPTGAGKTRMFAALSRWLRDKGLRTIILVPRREILSQTVKALAEVGVVPGQIAAGRPMTSDLVQVASIQTLVKRMGQARKPDLLIVDEAHHSTVQNSIGKILAYWPVPRVGFSATPQRLDGIGLRGTYDSLIIGPSLRALVAEGFLSIPYVLQPPGAEGGEYHVTRGDFDREEQEGVMLSGAIVGNVIEHYRKFLDGQPTICWCVSINHAKVMADQFRQAGYRAEAVWGDMDDDDRDSALSGLGDGRVQVVTFCDLIGEGVDIPAVAGAILLRKTMSLSLCRQVIGRALRPIYAPGFDLSTVEGRLEAQRQGPKPRAVILDHVGNTTSDWGHGHPLSEPVWSLDSQKRKKGEKPTATVTCPKCYGVWPGRPRTCPACGHSFVGAAAEAERAKLTEIEGTLVEAGFDDNEAHDMAMFAKAAMDSEPEKRQKMLLAKTFELLDEPDGKRRVGELARAVGFKDGWTAWAWDYATSHARR